jgi:hypothetical protein
VNEDEIAALQDQGRRHELYESMYGNTFALSGDEITSKAWKEILSSGSCTPPIEVRHKAGLAFMSFHRAPDEKAKSILDKHGAYQACACCGREKEAA